MSAAGAWLSVFAAASILVALAFFTVLQNRMAGRVSRGHWRRIAVTAAIGAAVALVLVALRPPGIAPLFTAPIAALGAFFAVVATSPTRSAPPRALPVYVFAALATALAALPALVVVFGSSFDPFATGLGFLDLGAALPALVAAGSAGIAIRWVERRRDEPASEPAISWRSALWPTLAMWAAWLGWLVGLELAIDALTPLIVTNAILMPFAGAIAGAVAERIRDRANTPLGLLTGLAAGLAAATPACAFLQPSLGVVVALIAGAVCVLLPRRGWASLLGALLVGAAIGLTLLGGFATDVSFIYTGQPEVLFGQLLGVVGTAVWSFAASAALWAVLRRTGSAARTRPGPGGPVVLSGSSPRG
jgi:Amt family ammonium transporter